MEEKKLKKLYAERDSDIDEQWLEIPVEELQNTGWFPSIFLALPIQFPVLVSGCLSVNNIYMRIFQINCLSECINYILYFTGFRFEK